MGETAKVDRWECPTKPDRKLSASALVNDHPPPAWRILVSDMGKNRRIRVVALTEYDALQRVSKDLPHVIVLLIEPISQMR